MGAGTIRDLVWGELYGSGFRPADVRDVDVVYFDPRDLRRAQDDEDTESLRAVADVPWEAATRRRCTPGTPGSSAVRRWIR